MAETRDFLRVFLASPGDLTDERRAAKQVVDEFNEQWGEHLGFHVELVGWEDTVACFGRPQGVINRDLERCEVFVGMLWKRWGTPPGGESQYTSGFEEEFNVSVTRRAETGGVPEIALFLKDIPAELLTDPGDDLKKVLAFRDKLVRERKLLYKEFKDIRDFERQLRRFISEYVRERKTRQGGQAADRAQGPDTRSLTAATPVEASGRHSLLSREGTEFLSNFLLKTEEAADDVDIPAVEIARFRLLGGAVHTQGNDEPTLGIHDLNLLYRNRNTFFYGEAERQALIDRGLQHFHNHNVPIWHWLLSLDGFTDFLLVHSSVLGSSPAVQVNALAAMTLIHQRLPDASKLPRDRLTTWWLRPEADGSLKVAALAYLAECGVTCDLTAVRQEFDKGDSQTVTAAADAFLRISLRDSHTKALKALLELQPGSIAPTLLAAIVRESPGTPVEQFLPGLEHRNAEVRLAVLRLLRELKLLTADHAKKLRDDGNSMVRYEALKTLLLNGTRVSIDEAKAALVRPVPGLYGTMIGGTGSGEGLFAEFSRDCLRATSTADLLSQSMAVDFFNRDAFHVLAERDFGRCATELRRCVDDLYKSYLEEAIARLRESFGNSSELLDQTQSLTAFVASGLARNGLDIICRNGDPTDLDRVRVALRSGAVGCSREQFEYLRSCGEWQDVLLIAEVLRRPNSVATGAFLGAVDESSYRAAANAMYGLGRSRLTELLALPMPAELLVRVLSEIPATGFRGLGNPAIMALLRSEHEGTRRVTALKCVQALPKRRVSALLSEYLEGDRAYYYNVVHWLDLGASAPREQALIAARCALREGRL